jgi:hypothetical protein
MINLEMLADWSQVITLPLSVIALLVALWTAFLQNRKKKLAKSVQIVPFAPIAGEYEKRVELLLDGSPIHDAYLAYITFRNSGKVELVSSDFITPLTLRFGKQTEILEAEVTTTSCGHRTVCVEVDAGTVLVQPGLMNPGERFTVRVVGMQIDDVQIDAHIIGVRDIDDIQPESSYYLVTAFVILALASLALFLWSPLLLGFITAGIAGFALQQIVFFRKTGPRTQ